MISEFGQILVFTLTALIFVGIVFAIVKLISPSTKTHEKLLTYECGENPEGSPWVKFNIRFYVVALIFLIFDVEVVMLIPWAMVYKSFGFMGFSIGAIFLLLLGLGMVYEWRKGDLEWARPLVNPPMIKRQIRKDTEVVKQEETIIE